MSDHGYGPHSNSSDPNEFYPHAITPLLYTQSQMDARVEAETRRCLQIIATTEPSTAGLSGMALQTRTAHDWVLAAKAAISTAITESK